MQLVLVKQALSEVDTKKLWYFRLPRIAASEETLRRVEAHLGESLDPQYREFLLHADGWPTFYQVVDLFGSGDLLGGGAALRGAEMLSYVEDVALAASGLRREDLLPIAVSASDLDLFVMLTKSSTIPGTVIWFAGSEVDRFPNFSEYFLAMTDYNREEVNYFLQS
ncbi:SMI1/KNR4 family protein [Rudaeicoccus suwonensis]|uniref:SMI1/KNR4 family protein n=1 Tax=Rudaeicoccus suwonensis TaxID=657409 RepID=UPI001BAA6148|nr:SMI1/KNR4 family protein [Rudaeicoccus suwonensis]